MRNDICSFCFEKVRWSYMFCLERQWKYEQTLYDIIHADVGRWKDLDRFWR